MTETENVAVEREKKAILYSLEELRPFFEQDNVTDIWVDNGKVSIKEFGKPRHDVNIFMDYQKCKNILVQIAKFIGIEIDYNNYPVLEGTIPYYEARITGVMKWTKYPFITIRKRPTKIFSIDDYVARNQCTKERAELIKTYIQKKKNILISGGTGSGKTTFTNACIKYMAECTPNDSFYIVEDRPELQCTARYAQMLTIETDQAMSAIKLALRCSPDRIIFGEIRDGKVLWALLDGWNTGHPGGISTIHANSAEGTFLRMRTLLKQAFGIEQPVNNLVDMIVHLSHSKETGIVVDEVIQTQDYMQSQIEEIARLSIENEIGD